MKSPVGFNDNVFVNCPFDDEFNPIFNAIIFAVHASGFIARCAKEFQDSDDVRIDKIFRIIQESKYGLHDLSRIDLTSISIPRFNMPLELGIFMGCKRFGTAYQKEKKYLVLDSEPYRYQQSVSDISGQDIQSHDNNPEEAIKHVRNWLATTSKRTAVPGASFITKIYEEFKEDLPEMCAQNRWDAAELTFPEYSGMVTEWLSFIENEVNARVPKSKKAKLNRAIRAL